MNAIPTDNPLIEVIGNQPRSASNGTGDSADDRHLSARILIVDDEALNIKITRKYLRSAGYVNFLDTTDSHEALALIYRESPDIVLLDIMMPGVDGLEILGALRSAPEFSH